MQHLEVNGAVRPIYGSLGVKRLISTHVTLESLTFRGKLQRVWRPKTGWYGVSSFHLICRMPSSSV